MEGLVVEAGRTSGLKERNPAANWRGKASEGSNVIQIKAG